MFQVLGLVYTDHNGQLSLVDFICKEYNKSLSSDQILYAMTKTVVRTIVVSNKKNSRHISCVGGL